MAGLFETNFISHSFIFYLLSSPPVNVADTNHSGFPACYVVSTQMVEIMTNNRVVCCAYGLDLRCFIAQFFLESNQLSPNNFYTSHTSKPQAVNHIMALSKFTIKKHMNDQQKDSTSTTRSKLNLATVEKTPRTTSFYCPRSLRAKMYVEGL